MHVPDQLDEEQLAQFYDRRWKDVEFVNSLKLRRASRILETVATLKIGQPRILDLGCGTGWLSNQLSVFGPTTGVDLSPAAIAAATERFPTVHFVQASFNELVGKGHSDYDLVVSHEVIEHVDNQRAHLELVHSFLRGGGWLVGTTPNRRVFQDLPPDVRATWSVQPIENLLVRRELVSLLRSCNFSHVSCSSTALGYGSPLWRRVASSQRVRHCLERVRLGRAWSGALEDLGFGLHLVFAAQAY
jgi:SAM-dependent methyltransferase